jgi:hypothetical protein
VRDLQVGSWQLLQHLSALSVAACCFSIEVSWKSGRLSMPASHVVPEIHVEKWEKDTAAGRAGESYPSILIAYATMRDLQWYATFEGDLT